LDCRRSLPYPTIYMFVRGDRRAPNLITLAEYR